MRGLTFDIAHPLAGTLVLVSFLELYQDRLYALLNMFALHALVLALSVAWQAYIQNAPHLYVTAAIALIFKAIIIPVALHRIIVRLGIHREIEKVVGVGSAMLLGMGLVAGPLPAVGNLVLHALYGITLGVMYGPTGYRSADDGHPATMQERQVLKGAERVAAGAALVGGLVGLAVGLVVLVFGEQMTGLVSGPAAAVLLATVIAGTALGAFVGSFAALPAAPETAD